MPSNAGVEQAKRVDDKERPTNVVSGVGVFFPGGFLAML